jgi:hypothetical protein
VQDRSGSTYASISFRAILNQIVEELGGLLWWGAVFHQQLEESSNSNFLQAIRTQGSIV